MISLAEPNVMNLLRKCDGMLALFKLAEGNLTETMSFAYAQRYEFGRAKRYEFAAQM